MPKFKTSAPTALQQLCAEHIREVMGTKAPATASLLQQHAQQDATVVKSRPESPSAGWESLQVRQGYRRVCLPLE